MSIPLSWAPAVALAVLTVAVLIVPVVTPIQPSPQSYGLVVVGPLANATVTSGPQIGVHAADPFFSIVFQDGGLDTPTLKVLGAFFNSTPITVFRFGGPGEGYDPTTSTMYAAPPQGGTYVASHTPPSAWNFSWMKSWCNSRVVHCAWLGYLPAELNNTQAAVHTAMWFHNVMGFVPTYWQFGNEPDHWTHYGKNRTVWSTADNLVPTGLDYATMVHNYITAVSAKFPADQYIGLENSGPGPNAGYAPDTAMVDGKKIDAMAYHFYPAVNGAGTVLSQYYGTLTEQFNVSWAADQFRGALTQNCTACGNIPIEMGEYQSGPSRALSPFSLTYAGAPFMAASMIQALRVNVSLFSPFDSTFFINYTTGAVLPEGMLYQRILSNMTMGADFATNLSAPHVGGLFSILIKNGTHQSLLIVNTNTTFALRLPISSHVFPVGNTGSYWMWGPSVAVPIAHTAVTLPTSYLIPQQGILLLDNY